MPFTARLGNNPLSEPGNIELGLGARTLQPCPTRVTLTLATLTDLTISQFGTHKLTVASVSKIKLTTPNASHYAVCPTVGQIKITVGNGPTLKLTASIGQALHLTDLDTVLCG